MLTEGGHFTIKRRPLAPPFVLAAHATRHYLAHVTPQAPVLPHEVARFPMKEPNGPATDYAFLQIPAHEQVDLRNVEGLEGFETLDFAPSPSEENSFLLAVNLARELRVAGHKALPALFVGDLDLPPQLRPFAKAGFTPPSYRSILSENGFSEIDLVLFAESVCRNRGKERVLERYKLDDSDYCRVVYERRGFALSKQNGIYYLVGDKILGIARFPVIALTKSENKTPTCAVIMAGKFLQMTGLGFSEILTIYDLADDPQISEKSREGMTIASYCSDEQHFRCVLVTIDSGGDSVCRVERRTSRSISRRGRKADYSDLVAEAFRRTQDQGVAAEKCSPAVCSSKPDDLYQHSGP